MRPVPNLTVPITLARSGGTALHEQIAGQVGAAIEDGLLPGCARLPSTRSLAGLLGVSRGVTIAAYDLLLARGRIRIRQGSGTFVTGAMEASPPAIARKPLVDMRTGLPSSEAFPLPAWRAAWRRAGFRRPPAQALPPPGVPALRRAISENFLGTRGAPLKDRQIVVTSGLEHGLSLVLEALGLSGPLVAVEEPSPATLWRAARTPAPLPVDHLGARVDEIPARCRAAVLTADAQIPYGTILSPERRATAAAWARETGGHLIEVACDIVPRPELNGVPPLSALAGDRAVLAGGFDELFTPGIRLGYVVAPRDLAAELARIIERRSEQPSFVTQLAMESMLRDGTVMRLSHRLGRLYARKRCLVPGGSGTLNCAVLPLPPGTDAEDVAAALLRRSIRVETLASYHFSGLRPSPAIVIGYGHLPDPVLARALETIAAVVGEVPTPVAAPVHSRKRRRPRPRSSYQRWISSDRVQSGGA